MTDICENIADILHTAEVANFADQTPIDMNTWNIHLARKPGETDNIIAILHTGGKPPNPKWAIDYPSIQIIVVGKANAYVETKDKAQDVKDALLGYDSADVNDDRIVAINMISDIVSLGFDNADRPMFSLNFSLIVEPEVGALSHRESL